MATDKITKRLLSPKVRVDITEERILTSVRRSSSHCMIAEALRDVLPEDRYRAVTVDLYTANFSEPEKALRYSYHLPRNAQIALIQFDRGQVPEPFSFTLQRAHKITRRRPSGARAGQDNRETKKKWRDGLAANVSAGNTGADRIAEDKKILDALNDPSAPLDGPRAISDYGPHGRETIIGGPPAPVFNFAQKRRFGLRQLAE